MKKYSYGADMGAFKIMSKQMSCFFENNFGDGQFDATIYEDGEVIEDEGNMDFKGHFTCNGDCYLMAFDCAEFKEELKLHKFERGRWFVYVDKEHNSHIKNVDVETHS